MNPPISSFKKKLTERIGKYQKEEIVWVGVGNRMLGDDGAGPVTIDHLQGHLPHLIDAGVTPEEWTGVIKRLNPEVIVFFDSGNLDSNPEEIEIIEPDEVKIFNESTHALSLDIIADYLKIETKADIFLIIFQYHQIHPSENLTPDIMKTITACTDTIKSLFTSV